jgi:poly-D-alanine transfer protein DltD
MQKRRYKVWLLVGMAVITLMVTLPGCGSSGITSEEAITIATQAVNDDGIMSLDGRDTVAVEEATYWHIYFPYTSHELLGGEPHVLVNNSNGTVIDLYYTQ